jgi:ribosomal protein S18 acetylase RimI-like enzyme
MPTYIRKCLPDELDTLWAIARETFDETFRPMNHPETFEKYLADAFNPEKLLGELQNPGCSFYLIYSDETLAGYLKLNKTPAQSDINDPDSLEIERIYVRKSHQGKGLGRVLLEFAMQQALEMKKESIWLGVWEKNTAAIGFYKKMGFREAGKHSFRMGDELQTDFIMKRMING